MRRAVERGGPLRSRDDEAASVRGTPEGSTASIVGVLALQRSCGNRAVARALGSPSGGRPLARFRRTDDYSYDGETGQVLFTSQDIVHRGDRSAPSYRRRTLRVDGDHLSQQEYAFDRSAQGPPIEGLAPGAWALSGAPTRVQKPKIRVSHSGSFAIEDVAQPRVFYIDRDLIPKCNEALARGYLQRGAEARHHPRIQILLTGGPALRVDGRQLCQASVEITTRPGEVAHVLRGACDQLASLVTTKSLLAASATPKRTDRRPAAPVVGGAFAFASPGVDALGDLPLTGEIEESIDAGLQGWALLERSVVDGLGRFSADVSDLARALTPGWIAHFEGVIASDPPDRLTLANYFRETEARYETRKLFRVFYRHNERFRERFLQKVRAERASAKHGRVDLFTVVEVLMDPFANDLRTTLTTELEKTALADLEHLIRVAKEQAATMWYFDIYGANEDSWETRWAAAGRGTRVTTWEEE
jgi:hypothetical protein